MAYNLTWGNSVPIVGEFIKVDYALDGGFTLFIHLIVFVIIVVAFYKKYNEFERGLVVAGFVTAFSSAFLTVIGYLPWKYIWFAISAFVIAMIAKAMEGRG